MFNFIIFSIFYLVATCQRRHLVRSRQTRGRNPVATKRATSAAILGPYVYILSTISDLSQQFATMAFAMDNYTSVKTFADSYLKFNYLRSDRFETRNNSNVILLQPHVIFENNIEISEVKFYNHAKGGNTIPRILDDRVNIGVWANNMPKITLLHVGACDIAGLDIGRNANIRYEFPYYVKRFLTKFKAIGREMVNGNNKARFDNDLKSHIFVYTGIPDWGDFGVGRPGCLSDGEFKTARRLANKGISACKSGLWTEHRTVVFTPRIINSKEQPAVRNLQIGDVHLYGHTAEEYGNQIFAALAKLLCSYCAPKSSYDEEEHTHNYLLGPCKRHQQGAGASVQ